MSKKVSITLDDDILSFVDNLASNRSSFINDVLWQEKQRVFLKELKEAYQDQNTDEDLQEEISVWNLTIADGLIDA